MGLVMSRSGLVSLVFRMLGQGGIVEAEVPELLLGIRAGSVLAWLQGDPGRDSLLAADDLLVGEMLGPPVACPRRAAGPHGP